MSLSISRKEINVKLTGENISLEVVGALEIAKFITSFAEIIKSFVETEENVPFLTLQGIKQGSIAFTFSTQYSQIEQAYLKVVKNIATNNYYGLPAKSIDGLKSLSKQSKKLGCEIAFHDLENQPVAKITPFSIIKEDEPIYIEGETTIYGYVESVGGNEKDPHARIKLSNESKKINCAVRDKEQIRKLGSLLYTEVGLVGFAKWRLPEMEIEHFLIKEILNYRGASFSETIDLLSKIAGNSFDNLDVENWLTEIRGDVE